MRHFFRQFTKTDYLFFTVCAIAYYFLIRQYIPCNWDDLAYCFDYSKEGYQYIDSIRAVLASNAYAYTHNNGRFLVHCLVQFFCGYGGAQAFFIGSTLMFTLLIMSLLYLVRRRTHSRIDKYWMLLGLMLLIPLPGVIFIGTIAFVVNYMWSAAVYAFFLCIYFHIKEDNIRYAWWQNLLLILFALVCGSWQESFSIGIAGALFFYHLVHLKDTRSSLLCLVLAFGIGACFGIFAPSNFARSERLGLTIFNMRHVIVAIIKHVPAVSVMVLLALASLIMDRKNKVQPSFIRDNVLFFLAPLFAVLFALIISFQGGEYQLTMVAVCAIILSIRFIYRYLLLPAKVEYAVAAAVVLLWTANYIPAYGYRQQLHNTFYDAIERYNDRDYCIDGELEHIDRELMKGSFYRRYISENFLHDFYSNTLIAEKCSRYLNKSGQTDCSLILPESKEAIIAACTEDNRLDSMLYASTRYSYYIIRLPLEEDRQQYTVLYNGYATTFIDKAKDKILRRQARPFAISLADIHNFHPRQFCTDTWRYVIVEPEAGTKRVPKDMRLQKR